ncbi:MAG: NAD-dependent epimerase [Alphaproteobacteria bacterium]|nr:NAD-dependent epimerase [Alphaproteobacteria bacterium]
MKPVLVTGAAGFIGYHLSERLMREGRTVIGYDCMSDYYSVELKQARVKQLQEKSGFTFVKAELEDAATMDALFKEHQFDLVYNLAAQAGVRYSLENPQAYVSANLEGFVNILECCRHNKTAHLVFASSSSVYGAGTAMPFSVHQNVDHPLSVYAASKKANELFAHSYAHLYRLPVTGLRFFTVYGPWGRPDMMMFLFTKAILEGRPIDVFNNGLMKRDFTYVDDIVESLYRVGLRIPGPNPNWDSLAPDPATSNAPYQIYNIGNHSPAKLLDVIAILEQELGKAATKNMLPMQPGDVPATFADVEDLARDVDFAPRTPIEVGVKRFVEWYREYYRV